MAPRSNPPLFDAVRRGESWAERQVMEELERFARHICHSGSSLSAEMDPEDLAQEAARRFFTVGLEQYRGGGSEGSYLYSIVKSMLVQAARTRRRRLKREDVVAPVDESHVEDPDPKLEVGLLLRRLGEACRELLQRVFLDETPYPVLAADLDLAESSVRAKVSRCLRRAREAAEG